MTDLVTRGTGTLTPIRYPSYAERHEAAALLLRMDWRLSANPTEIPHMLPVCSVTNVFEQGWGAETAVFG